MPSYSYLPHRNYMVKSFRPYGIAYFPPAVHHCNEVKECGMQPKWQQGDAKIGKNSKYTKTRYNTVKSSEITATMTLQIPMIGGYIWQLSSLSESKKHHWHSFVKTDTLRSDCHNHSMARANLNKSELQVTNTTAASKYLHTYEAQNLHQLKSPIASSVFFFCQHPLINYPGNIHNQCTWMIQG